MDIGVDTFLPQKVKEFFKDKFCGRIAANDVWSCLLFCHKTLRLFFENIQEIKKEKYL
jgi:hypothetical protein